MGIKMTSLGGEFEIIKVDGDTCHIVHDDSAFMWSVTDLITTLGAGIYRLLPNSYVWDYNNMYVITHNEVANDIYLNQVCVPSLCAPMTMAFKSFSLEQFFTELSMNKLFVQPGSLRERSDQITQDLESKCKHTNKYINHAGGQDFWFCPDCKQDLGNE